MITMSRGGPPLDRLLTLDGKAIRIFCAVYPKRTEFLTKCGDPVRFFMVLLFVVAFFSARGFDSLMERGGEVLKSRWKNIFFLAMGLAVCVFI